MESSSRAKDEITRSRAKDFKSHGIHRKQTAQEKRRLEALRRQKTAKEDRQQQAREMAMQANIETEAAEDGGDVMTEMGSAWWYLDVSECEQGPFDLDTMHAWVQSGQLDPASLRVRRDGDETFSLMEDIFPGAGQSSVGLKQRVARARRLREYYEGQFVHPEWLVDVPPDLASEWYVIPRPEGDRCLVVASNGQTNVRLRNGRIKHHFPSLLPGGSHKSAESGYSILDCIFYPGNKTYYVLDMICWNGHAVADSDSEFRLFWAASKLQEVPVAQQSHYNRFTIIPLPVYNADAAGIALAYEGLVPYRRDGLAFLNKHAMYHGSKFPNPLSLLWKDEKCSRYTCESHDKVNPMLHVISLLLREDGNLCTGDEIPAELGSVTRENVLEHNLQPGTVLKFSITGIVEDKIQVIGAEFLGKASVSRRPDSWSKIVFQHQIRHDPITIVQLCG